MFRQVFLLFILFDILIAIIPAAVNFMPTDPNHTCETSEECSKRLNHVYPPYHFVCCTTVACGKESSYYSVSSGCAPEHSCTQVAFNGTSRFAARLLKHNWDSIKTQDQQCSRTAQLLGAISDITTYQNETEDNLDLKRRIGNLVQKRAAVVEVRPSCSLSCSVRGEVCCTDVKCEETLQKGAVYRLKEFCSKNCTTMGFTIDRNGHCMAEVQQFNVPQSYRDSILKWNGWGYKDSYFTINQEGNVMFTGDKYDMSGQTLPLLRPWFEQNLGIELDYKTPSQPLEQIKVNPPNNNQEFIDYLRVNDISYSNAPHHRLMRSHGHTVHDMLHLRHSQVPRCPDLVVWPKDEKQVTKVVEGANNFNVCIIPIGGGTSVSNALDCPSEKEEQRSIISLDMSQMDKILWIDNQNLTCRAEAGIIGQSLERQLNAKGYTCGHEPDSIEFSSLGGWVSTRASGMKKNRYGNIEDLVIHVNLVTSKGIIHKQCQVPRISSGPDVHQIILGSEGTLGVITEVTIKVFPLPEVKRYGSYVFPDFDQGVAFFREVARQRIQPASLRLVDNEQFIMGQALKMEQKSYWAGWKASLSKLYITKWKGFQIDEMVAATCVFEGTKEEVDQHEKRLNSLAEQFNGVVGGEENGKYGYRLTFAIAYLRDLGMEYGILGESFETSVPWDKVLNLCRNVKQLIKREAKKAGVKYPVLASCRVTQIYDAGACVYFYFGFNSRGCDNGLEIYDKIETAARDEIIACGGSISHHHGVGKLRKQWMQGTVGTVGVSVLRAIKHHLDPNNVFASGNLVDVIGNAKL